MLKHRLFYIFLGVAMAMAGCGGNGAPSGVTTSGLKTVYQVSTADDPNRRIMYFSITHGYVQSPTVDLQFQYLPFATAATMRWCISVLDTPASTSFVRLSV